MKSSDGCRIYNSISAEDTSLNIWAEAVSDTSRSEMNIDLIRIKVTLWAAVFSGDLMKCFMANSSVKFASLRRVYLWNLSDGLFGQKDQFKGFVQAKRLSRSSLGGGYGDPEPDLPPSKRQWQGKTFEQGETSSRSRLIWERREGKRQIPHMQQPQFLKSSKNTPSVMTCTQFLQNMCRHHHSRVISLGLSQ